MSEQLDYVLNTKPEDLLLPNEKLRDEALSRLKQTLDPIAANFSVLNSVHVDGLHVDQVWLQAKMIIDGASERLYRTISELVSENEKLGDLLKKTVIAGSFSSDQEFTSSSSDKMNNETDTSSSPDPPSGSSIEKVHILQKEGHKSGLDEPEVDLLTAGKNDESSSEEDEVDYFAEIGSNGVDDNIKYNDFFDSAPEDEIPDSKEGVASEESSPEENYDNEDEMQDASEISRMELFSSEDEKIQSRSEYRSKVERQRAELEKQIEQYEDENVGEKEWGMKGEVQAGQRPANSLMDVDVDFQRNFKPPPVDTQESTETLEAMIRERIQKKQFDDIPKRVALAELKPKQKLPDVNESKSQKSLAEIYEEEYQRSQNPEFYKKEESKVIESAHNEIIELYKSLAHKLDALCSWRYVPKPPELSLTVVSDAPTIMMEDAQPSTLGANSQLAPHEVYKPTAGSKDEIVGRDGIPIARSELDKEERRRLHRRKKMQHKSETKIRRSGGSEAKDEFVNTLKRANVTIIDKRGQKRDVDGNIKKSSSAVQASQIKL